jgi:tetratricopeptide (TPR) repeat protein
MYPLLGFIDTTAAARAARGDAAKRALENAQKLEPNSPETLLAFGYYQYRVLRDFGAAKTTFGSVSKMLPGSSEVPYALGQVSRWEGHLDESISYYEQALSMDPRNVELLGGAAWTYAMLRQFPAALMLYDHVLDITPNDPDVMASKASIYLAQGNLHEAAKLLETVNAQTDSALFFHKISLLRLERNYDEAIRLMQAGLAQLNYDTEEEKGCDQARLAFLQFLAGDAAGAKVTAEGARNTLERLYREKRTDSSLSLLSICMSKAYSAIGEKDSALQAAERAIMLYPSAKDPVSGPMCEENLALIQTMFGENNRAISILSQLLRTPYNSLLYYPTPITPTLLKLDPLWDRLRADPAFQKLCQEKQPPPTL